MMNKSRIMLAAILVFAPAAAAQDAQPSLDELLDIAPPVQPAVDKPVIDQAQPVPLDPDAARRLSIDEAADIFKEAIVQMDEAAARLGDQRDAGLLTQRVQESILAKLEQVVDAAVQQQQQQQSSQQSGRNGQGRQGRGGPTAAPQQQQQTTTPEGNTHNDGRFSPGQVERVGPDGQPLNEMRSEWGNLPARLRDELLQGVGERFSPVYRELTEMYYQRLAEDQQ